MKLEIEFAVAILEAIESADSAVIEEDQKIMEGGDPGDEKYSYHCLMLSEAGLIKIWKPRDSAALNDGGYTYVDKENAIIQDFEFEGTHRIFANPMMLTFEGHTFLEAMRLPERRNSISKFLEEKGLPFAISVVKESISSYIRQQAGM